MSDNAENEEHSLTEDGAPETHEKVSPPNLDDFGFNYLINIWIDISEAKTVKQHQESIAALVFHARHLQPEDHAHLSRLILNPIKERRGRPKNHKLREAADARYLLQFGNESIRSQDLVFSENVSKENARGALLAAKRRKAAGRGEE
jgi:hypothetical protein